MRYATVVLRWDSGHVHPIDGVFARNEDVSLEAIRYVSPVYENRYVELLELSGDLETARRLLAESSAAIEFDVAGDERTGVAYIQCHTAGLVEDLLTLLCEHDIVLEWPMAYVGDGSDRALKLTVFGTSRAIQRAASDLPAGIDLDLERTGEYEPDVDRLSSILTERQLEVFDLAAREGYFEIPRETTHSELAAKLEVAPGTVSEHLQRIEVKLVATYLESV